MKKLLVITATLLLLTIGIVSLIAASADLSKDVLPDNLAMQIDPAKQSTVASCVTTANGSELVLDKERYLQVCDFRNIVEVNQHLLQLSAMDSSLSLNNQLSDALNNALWTLENKRWKSYRPDSILATIQWAEKFRYYASFNPRMKRFYKSVYGFWMNVVVEQLRLYHDSDPSLKYDFQYMYLVNRCAEQRYNADLRETKAEKFFFNLFHSNFGHLSSAFWNQSSVWLKLALLSISVIFGVGVYVISNGTKVFIYRIINNKKAAL